jgi:hypothetical protein
LSTLEFSDFDIGCSAFSHPDALVSGLAHGMHRPLLMLAEGNFPVPIDYRDLLKQYQTASEAEKHFDVWILGILSGARQRGLSQKAFVATVEMARELNSLRIGEFIAENEAERLRNEYFIETAAYREALEGRQTIFVGRKGAGKSANLIKLADAFAADKRNLVCVLKPIAYDFQGVVSLLKMCRDADIKGYMIESLWKFLIYSEIANAAANAIRSRPSGGIEKHERKLMALADANNSLLEPDFSIRLERCIKSLQTAVESGDGIEERQKGISESLHRGFLKDLRNALSEALAAKNCVSILIDNLDKAWDKQSDIPSLTEFLLGLLKAASRISNDFRDVAATHATVNVSLAVFIRADIFYRVMSIARERDKIPYSKLVWTDAEQLIRVIEERMMSSRTSIGSPRNIWERYFEKEVKGMPVKDYLLSRIMPRPRDLLYLMKSAITTAVNRKHTRITSEDILAAEKQYSQFAIDSILVENGISLQELETVIYEFVGYPSIVSIEQVNATLHRAGIPTNAHRQVTEHLCNLTFLGIEVRENEFRFAEDEQEARKDAVLARRLAETLGRPSRFKINPAFCAFLEIDESPPNLTANHSETHIQLRASTGQS